MCYVLKIVFSSKSDNIHKNTDKISREFYSDSFLFRNKCHNFEFCTIYLKRNIYVHSYIYKWLYPVPYFC